MLRGSALGERSTQTTTSTPLIHNHAAAAAGMPADRSLRTAGTRPRRGLLRETFLVPPKIGEAVELSFAGAVLDVGVSDLGRAETFYSVLLGRGPDLQPQPDQREWFMHRAPEVDFRITLSPRTAGSGSLSLGVADLGAERSRLLGYWPDLPAAHEKPGIITMVRIQDPDGNEVTLWQDLMPARHR